jgi:hypothetical protein
MLLDFDSWSRHVDDGCFPPPGEATFFLVALTRVFLSGSTMLVKRAIQSKFLFVILV